MPLIIGIDFDNTIVCYDTIFHQIALEQRLIPPTIAQNKEAVRDYLRQQNQEERWTELQGYVYGARLRDAPPFSGVKDFINLAMAQQALIYIISHKTLTPYRGPAYNLHDVAMDWLNYQGFFELGDGQFSPQQVFFETSIDLKLHRIGLQQCDYFIDDLPEVLGHPDFPTNAQKILFRSGVLPSIEQNDTGRDLLRQYDSVASVPSPTSRRPAACPQDQTNFYSWVTIANYILEEASCL